MLKAEEITSINLLYPPPLNFFLAAMEMTERAGSFTFQIVQSIFQFNN